MGDPQQGIKDRRYAEKPVYLQLLQGLQVDVGHRDHVALAGLAIALSGIGVLNSAPAKGSGVTALGDLLIVGAAATFALFTVFGKRVTVRHGSVTVNTLAYSAGALVLSPITIWQGSQFSFGSPSV